MNRHTTRTDPAVERALDCLAAREQQRARQRAEAEALCDDPDDVEASRQLAAEMDTIRAR